MRARAGDISGQVSARHQCVRNGWKNLTKSDVDSFAYRRWFADLLWVAFPSGSEHELCQVASRALGVHVRTVKNWLILRNDAPWTVVAKVMLIARVEPIFQKIEGKRQ